MSNFKNWLFMSESKKKKLFNLDKPKAPEGKKITIKLGEVQPDTLFSDRGHMPIKKGVIHEKKPTRGEEKKKWRKDQDM